LAHHTDKRTDAACQKRIDKLAVFPIRSYYPENWQRDANIIPPAHQCIGKDHTWKIERTNLNVRTPLKRLHRKTICFSKHETIHDHVIGMEIHHHDYHNNGYAKAA